LHHHPSHVVCARSQQEFHWPFTSAHKLHWSFVTRDNLTTNFAVDYYSVIF
jgi:hypothetical protein